MQLIKLHNFFTAQAKELGISFVFGNMLQLDKPQVDRNSVNINAETEPPYPRMLMRTPYQFDIKKEPNRIKYYVDLILRVKEDMFLTQNLSYVERTDYTENLFAEFYRRIKFGQYPSFVVEVGDLQATGQGFATEGAIRYHECEGRFSIEVITDCPDYEDFTDARAVPTLYNPLAYIYGDIPADKDIRNHKNY